MNSLGTKIGAVVVASSLLGLIGTIEIIPVTSSVYVREKPTNESQFIVRDADFNTSGLIEAHKVGFACYGETKGKRERIDCDEWDKNIHTKDWVQPWDVAYRTILFDTPSGDLDEGYYYPNKDEISGVDWLFSPEAAEAAITRIASTSQAVVGVSTVSFNVTVTTGDFLSIMAVMSDATDGAREVSACTYNAVACDAAQAAGYDDAARNRSEGWSWDAAPATGTHTLQIDFVGIIDDGYVLVVEASGVHQTAPLGATVGDEQQNTATFFPSPDLTTTAAGSWIMQGYTTNITTNLSFVPSATSSPTQVEELDVNGAVTDSFGVTFYGPFNTPGAVPLTIGCTGTSCGATRDWTALSVEIKPAAAAAPGASFGDVFIFN